MSIQAQSSFKLRLFAAFILAWAVLVAGFYLWSVRGPLGFQSTSYLSIEMGTSSGAMDIVCSIQTPIRPSRPNELRCEVRTPPTNIPTAQGYPIRVEIAISGDGFVISPPEQHIALKSEGPQSLTFIVEPTSSGNRDLIIVTGVGDTARATKWPVSVELKTIEIIFFPAAFAIFVVPIYSLFRGQVRSRDQLLELTEAKIEKAEEKAASEPTKARFAWDLARVKLEAYFDRNLFQVNQVFWLAVVMVAIGFAFVLAAVVMSLSHSDVTPASKVAALSGIITQFIGATFLAIYRSTMAQANEFMSVLERINTVGMAVQVLDSIPEANSALKDQTRAQIVELLLSANIHSKPRKRISRGRPKPAE